MTRVEALLKTLEDTSLASGIRHSLYIFPFMEAIHVIAISLVFGTITVIDLRILGVASTNRSFARMSDEMLKWTWVAFVFAALSGVVMFVTNARVYFHNTAFQIKMVLLVAAAINMGIFHLTEAREAHRWDTGKHAIPRGAKLAGFLSMLLWVAVIGAGRVIGFTTTGAEAKEDAPQMAPENFDQFLSGAADGPTNKGP